MAHKIAAPAAAAALLLLAGCSGGGAADPPPQSEPTVSTPPDPTLTTPPALTGDFATAVNFTKLVHKDKYKEAAELALPESPAARYVAHQVLMQKAERINGVYFEPSTRKVTFKPEAAKGSIKITERELLQVGDEADDGEKERKVVYTWHSFTFDQGKLTGWTGKTGPVKDVLWSRTTSDESRGTKAELKSAYRANSGNLYVVAELSTTSKGRSFGDATYTAKGGYRQVALEQGAMDVSRGEKTLAYFAFEDAKFGGTVHLEYYDEQGTAEGDWALHLAIK
jgi:hypothetical protein